MGFAWYLVGISCLLQLSLVIVFSCYFDCMPCNNDNITYHYFCRQWHLQLDRVYLNLHYELHGFCLESKEGIQKIYFVSK